ncbi:Extracellular ligand-binding receptor [Artemisia annua]|uniref:Extracellular ligand-binding receptor n=1 Tax=Artemisia annua TaxID=35608 RepID=A0A2U1L2Q6_ARTAN|nr:Extracellular ligand-binding receptor [Artemisia annua]
MCVTRLDAAVNSIFITSQMNFDDSMLKSYNTFEQIDTALKKGSQNGGASAILDELPYIRAHPTTYVKLLFFYPFVHFVNSISESDNLLAGQAGSYQICCGIYIVNLSLLVERHHECRQVHSRDQKGFGQCLQKAAGVKHFMGLASSYF